MQPADPNFCLAIRLTKRQASASLTPNEQKSQLRSHPRADALAPQVAGSLEPFHSRVVFRLADPCDAKVNRKWCDGNSF